MAMKKTTSNLPEQNVILGGKVRVDREDETQKKLGEKCMDRERKTPRAGRDADRRNAIDRGINRKRKAGEIENAEKLGRKAGVVRTA